MDRELAEHIAYVHKNGHSFKTSENEDAIPIDVIRAYIDEVFVLFTGYSQAQSYQPFVPEELISYIESREVVPMKEPVKAPVQKSEPVVLPIDQLEFFEGDKKVVKHTSYERSREARETCLRQNGTACIICGFDSATVYGEEFADKIHVHHIIPISQMGTTHQVNASYGLLPVCPNCHMILHTKMPNGEYISWTDLKKRYASRNNK